MPAYDPFDPVVLDDPYPAYAEVRADTGLTHNALLDAWLVSRYEDVVGVLRQARLYSSARGMGDLVAMAFESRPDRDVPRLLILEDPPVHTALRRMVARGFTPSRIAVSEPMITDIARRHVDDLVEHGETGDLMRDLAIPFPVRVIAELLGIPPSRFAEFRAWSEVIVKAFSITPDPAGADAATEQMNAFFAEIVDERIARPGRRPRQPAGARRRSGRGSAVARRAGQLLHPVAHRRQRDHHQPAGQRARGAAATPGAEARLRADRTLVGAVRRGDPALRLPVQSLFRGLSGPATLAGVDLPEGARIMVLLGAANRDSAKFDAADEVRLDRFAAASPTTSPSARASTCASVHHSPGSKPRAALDALLEATSSLQATGAATRTASFLLRGCTTVPLHAVPA